ncbi:P-loop containing nucleoside triphosphate hydrolase protein [Clavulina sp. PMI_390]|nr:P-loop containing nucleoside triphosphate hydrolase protein [Clavulina sp. PMI_390]
MSEDVVHPVEELDAPTETESTLFSDSESTPLVAAPSDEKDDPKADDVYLRTSMLGCYEMIEEVSRSKEKALPGASIFEHVEGFRQDLPYVMRFLKDCAEQGGTLLLVAWLVFRMLLAASPAISLYFSAQLMNFIQALIRQEQGATNVGYPEFYHVAGSVLLWRLVNVQAESFFDRNIERPLQHRINSFFEEKLFQAKARLDLPTSSNPIVEARFGDIAPDWVKNQGWRMLSVFAVVPSSILSIIAQVSVLYGLIQSEGGGWFALFAAVGPILDSFSWSSHDSKVFYVHLINPLLKRMKEMKAYVDQSHFRRQIIADGLQSFISKEYHRARAALTLRSMGSAREIYYDRKTLVETVVPFVTALLDEAPTVLFAFQSLHNGKALPLASLTLISSTVSSITWQLRETGDEFQSMTGFHKNVRALYEVMEWENEMKDGELSYPKDEKSEGMKIEFRSVSFKYPREDNDVLSDLSFVIQPGQLCVIVGENGCGKTSTVNLIGRMYDVTKGNILIDNVPIQDWRGDDLRRTQAVLYQNFHHYRTTLGENIGYGDIDQLQNHERIRACAEAAGALSFIEKQPSGFDSEVYSQYSEWSELSNIKADGPLQKRIDELERSVHLSGGQWQRLAIARTFMRVMRDEKDKNAPNTRLLCYDEPSSALDPKAEYELFEKLRTERGKRTLIFITHRFGHLTKHADVILYMKEGRIIEQGTHAELVALGGSYANLYNVQAQAFQ